LHEALLDADSFDDLPGEVAGQSVVTLLRDTVLENC
jgi:hypothetical protein